MDTSVQIKYDFAGSSTGNNTMRMLGFFLKSVFHSPLYVVTLKADLSACWPSHTSGGFVCMFSEEFQPVFFVVLSVPSVT